MKFILGERKEVTVRISSAKSVPFTIRNPAYELVQNTTGSVVLSGDANVIDHDVYVLVEPPAVGLYRLIFSYDIGTERLKAAVQLQVERA